MTVDPAELLLGLEQAGGTPAQRHGPAVPTLDVARVVTADLDHRLDGVGGAQRARERRRDTESGDGERLGESLTQRAGGTGVLAFELFGQCLEVPLAGERVLSLIHIS